MTALLVVASVLLAVTLVAGGWVLRSRLGRRVGPYRRERVQRERWLAEQRLRHLTALALSAMRAEVRRHPRDDASAR